MKNWRIKYLSYLKNKKYFLRVALSFLFLLIGVAMTYFAIIYATESASASVTDVILSNLPVLDVANIFVYGPVIFWVIVGIYFIFLEPKKLPFTLNSIAAFLFIRSFFISMTHIGPFPDQNLIISTGFFSVFTTGKDLFFSSHTGLPFLMTLLFWDVKYLRAFCLVSSLFFGAVVLLGHMHYSIDVFAAFFITYTILQIAKYIFPKDYDIFRYGLNEHNN
ncbi:MAG: phosphatase PAP2-related protein [Patescibacteria group bacterium]